MYCFANCLCSVDILKVDRKIKNPFDKKRLPKNQRIATLVRIEKMFDDFFFLNFYYNVHFDWCPFPYKKLAKLSHLIYCKEGGVTTRQFHFSKSSAFHFTALKVKQANEAFWYHFRWNNCHNYRILHLIASICWKPFLLDVVIMRECNHQTASEAYIWAITCWWSNLTLIMLLSLLLSSRLGKSYITWKGLKAPYLSN